MIYNKKYLLFMMCCFMATACDHKIEDQAVRIFLKSYVTCYQDGMLMATPIPGYENQAILVSHKAISIKKQYAPEFSEDDSGDEFLEIAERNGDRSYDRWKRHLPGDENAIICMADNFEKVKVVCLNKAWDDSHPAKVSLNDLVEIEYRSAAEYVRHNYNGEEFKRYRKSLTELGGDDLSLIVPGVRFYFMARPMLPGSYEVEVTLVTTEGVEKSAEWTFTFE